MRFFPVTVIAVFLFFLASCHRPVPGGFTPVKTGDPVVVEAADVAMVQINSIHETATLSKILSAEEQVVAGTNYDLVLRLEDRSVWDVRVFRDLAGQMKVTKISMR